MACGKAPGILTTNEEWAHRYIELGSLFTAVGVDMALLMQSAETLAQRFKGDAGNGDARNGDAGNHA